MRNGGDPCILIVDDDPDILQTLALCLSTEGYKILMASNGREALDVVENERPSVILLDLMMPVMNGWDFRRKQRETPAFANIPVLLMSAGAHMATVSGELNAAGYVTKPVEMSDLLAVVQQHCP
jgi:DNA-binding response OmpR family regulator